MSKIRVGVLRGGGSPEYEISLKGGANVLKYLPAKYTGHDILVTKDGIWHFEGIPVTPEKLFRKVDVIFNTLQDENDSGRNIQQIFETHGFPYTGPSSLATSVASNKLLTKKALSAHGIKMPYSIALSKDDYDEAKVVEIFRTFPFPAMVKPLFSTLSRGVSMAKTARELSVALEGAFAHSPTVVIEEYISGKDAKCVVLEGFRGQKHYSFLPIEVVQTAGKEWMEVESRAAGEVEKRVPGNFTPKEKADIERIAKQVHGILGLRHYSRSDFRVSPRRGVYFLEVDVPLVPIPNSSLHRSLTAVGATLPQFIEHVVELARK